MRKRMVTARPTAKTRMMMDVQPRREREVPQDLDSTGAAVRTKVPDGFIKRCSTKKAVNPDKQV
jgi:hypothetical protein